jgi:nucleoside-triphosphatase
LKRIFFLTGRPGVGKTTVLLRTVEELREKGFSIGGIVSQEAREGGSRVGFKIVDLDTEREGWLAHVRHPRGPKVGRYKVCLEDLESVGVNSILNATMKADIIVIDEIGPMELFSQAFRESVTEALNSKKTVLGTIHHRVRDPLIFAIKNREDAKIIEVTKENRDGLAELVVQKISEILVKSQGEGKGYCIPRSL